MFSTRNAAEPTRLTVIGAATREYDGHSRFAEEPTLLPYLADMARPYGADIVVTAPSGHSHAEMAEPLITELADGHPIDVLALAQRMHDVSPGRATATYLGSRCAGSPLAFAVCDQGTAAPFTALRLLDAYARTGKCHRALLLIVEQATLHYTPVTPTPLPDHHTAVALLLAAGPSGFIVQQRTESTIDKEIETRCADHPNPIVLRGTGHLPLTGPWQELATGLDKWSTESRRVVLADHDPTTGLLSTATIDLPERR